MTNKDHQLYFKHTSRDSTYAVIKRCILFTWDKHSKTKTLAKDRTIANKLIYQVNSTSVIIPAAICNSIHTALLPFLNLKPQYCNVKSSKLHRD